MSQATTATPPTTGGLPNLLRASWGLGTMGATSIIYLQSLFVLFFFTTVLGIDPGLAGSAMLVAKISDIALGIIIGRLSDKTRSRMGRRRPWMLAGAATSAIGTLLVFNPPVVHPLVQIFSLVVMGLGYCLFTVPYLAMPSEMTDSPGERTILMSWRVGFVALAEMLAKSAMPLIAASFGGGRSGYGVLGLMAAVLIGSAMLFSVIGTKKAVRLEHVAPETQAPAFSTLKAVLGNKPFMLLMATKAPQLFGYYVSLATLLFFFTTALGGGAGLVAIWGTVSNVTMLLTVPLWLLASRWLEKRTLYILGSLGYVGICLSWLLAGYGEPASSIIIRAAICGFFQSGPLLMGQAMLPDSIAYDTNRSGVARQGAYTAAYSLTEKTCSALGPFVVGWILHLAGVKGMHGAAAAATPETLHALYLTIAIIPAIAYFFGLTALLFYPLRALGANKPLVAVENEPI